MVRGRSFSRTLVRGRNKVAHKLKGIDGRFYRSEVVCERSTLSDSHQSSDGQYDCLLLYKPFRRNRFYQSLHARSQNVEVVPTKKYPHFSCLHCRSTQLHSRHSVPINLNSEWKLNPAIFRQICVIYTTPDLDLFATRANNQLQKFISWFPDPDALATNAFSIPWSNQVCYAFPPYSQIMKCLKKSSLTKPRFSSLLRCGGRDRGFEFYYQCFTIARCCFSVLQIY